MSLHKFEFEGLPMDGSYLISPFCAEDDRGCLIKEFNADIFTENNIDYIPKEIFYTVSKKGVMRALHFQLGRPQAKLVRCISGHVYDVIVDLRPWSPTYRQWMGFHLTGQNMKTLFVPEYFGHGYLVIEDSVVSYICGEVFYDKGDTGIYYDDPEIGVEWPFEMIEGKENMIISEKDKNLMSFAEYEEILGKEI